MPLRARLYKIFPTLIPVGYTSIMSMLAEPWKKERSKSSSQRGSQRIQRAPSQIIDRKETKLGRHMSSDEDVSKSLREEKGEDDDDEEEDPGPPPDPEMKKLAAITKLHGEFIALCKRKDDGNSNTRPDFTNKFEPQYMNVLDASGEYKKTLLHNLAKSAMKGSGLQSTSRWLVKAYPQLILEKDSDHHTALYYCNHQPEPDLH